MNTNTERKRADLANYIKREVIDEPAVQGIVVIGSVAKGIARANSDVDAFVFLDPYDLYAVPAEAKWNPETGRYHGIMSHVEEPVQLDFKRVDLAAWSEPAHVWPDSIRAELSEGWVAFDRFGRISPLIESKTFYSDAERQTKVDEAVSLLNWLLSEALTGRPYDTLGATAAHYRLHSTFDYLIQAIFAINRRWRTLRSRELSDLVALPWLPSNFEADLFLAMNAPSSDKDGYHRRALILHRFFEAVVAKCQEERLYNDNPLDEAFIRQHDELGRDWNMVEWEQTHNNRAAN